MRLTRKATILLATGVALALSAAAAVPAHATYTSTLAGSTATLTDSGTTNSNVAIFAVGGLLGHSLTSAGFTSPFDWNTAAAGDQVLANDPASSISILAGSGNDGASIGRESVGGASPIVGSWASAVVAPVTFDGAGGTDRFAVDNAGDPGARTYSLAPASIGGASTAVFDWEGTEELRLLAGDGADDINVSGVLPKTTIYAGSGDDTLDFGDGATLSGGIADGGPGQDDLDYASYTTPVQVDLGAEQAFVADPMNGANERPTPRESNSTGTMIMKFDGTTLVCDLDTAIRHFDTARMVGAHLHRGGVSASGPIIVQLDGNAPPANLFTMFGDLATRTKNFALPADEEDDLVSGGVYINIHSTTFTGGEIRGQVLPDGEAGPATGTGWQARFEDVTGGSAGDTLTGGSGANDMTGGNGNDVLSPGLGRDTVNGGAHLDTISYSDRATRVAVNLDGARNDGADPNNSNVSTSTEEGDQDLSIENATGSQGNDWLRGGSGVNTLNGEDGDDVFDGGAGGDNLNGNGSSSVGDTVTYASRTGPVAFRDDGVRNDGADPNRSGVSTTTEEGDRDSGIENVTGGSENDRLVGDGAANTMTGGVGNDLLTPGLGRDTANGGGGSDTLDYSERTASVAVRLDGLRNDGLDPNQSGVSTSTEEGDQDLSIEHARGGSAADKLLGSAIANVLLGNGGDDWFDGGLGPDDLNGGLGVDRILYTTRTARVAVRLDGLRNDGLDPNASGASAADEENDLDVSIEEAAGGSGPDRMFATVSDGVVNLLIGNEGDDRIKTRDGTATNDTANCGLGADIYDKDPSDTHTTDCETAGIL